MQRAASGAGPNPAVARHGQESQPSPRPPRSCPRAGCAEGLEQPRAQPYDLQDPQEAAASHPLPHADPSPPGAQSQAGAALGSPKRVFRTRPQQGQPRQPLPTKGEQPRGTEGLSPERGYWLGLPFPQGTSQPQPPSPWPLPSPAQILPSLHIFGRDRS